ncbi:MAG: cyclodeaminase/cyclohydrolase family protein [Oscillospiraceae bacterium]|nr:cyclodeaminase/cyclohydrolase family protein [Oscillospiraceae bacterium]
MSFGERTLKDFSENLASRDAVPGGGGAAALVGAAGAALGCMVANLTIGKAKYAEHEDELKILLDKCNKIRLELIACIDKDAQVFEPLARAYRIPKDNPEKVVAMEGALKGACAVPLEIMAKCCLAIECCREFAEKGSAMALSDAASGAVFCKAALEGASLNVFINTKSMADRIYAYETDKAAEGMLKKYRPIADEAFTKAMERLRG